MQHLSSVAIFVCCFVGLYLEQVSPESIVGLSSAATVLGWVLWDFWVAQVEAAKSELRPTVAAETDDHSNASAFDGQTDPSSSRGRSRPSSRGNEASGLGLTISNDNHGASSLYSRSGSVSLTPSVSSDPSPILPPSTGRSAFPASNPPPGYYPPDSAFSQRNQKRLATAKSAILICCALLGLSPILKSLTESTSKDSIWAMSSWLMAINIFFFDYGGGVGVK